MFRIRKSYFRQIQECPGLLGDRWVFLYAYNSKHTNFDDAMSDMKDDVETNRIVQIESGVYKNCQVFIDENGYAEIRCTNYMGKEILTDIYRVNQVQFIGADTQHGKPGYIWKYRGITIFENRIGNRYIIDPVSINANKPVVRHKMENILTWIDRFYIDKKGDPNA